MAYQTQPAVQASSQSLLAQVLGITALGLCITALAVYLFPNVSFPISMAAMIGGIVLVFVMNSKRESEAVALSLFYVFTFLWGIGLSPIIQLYLHLDGPSVVFNAALTTALGMFALGAIVYGTGLDLRRFQGYVMLALLGLFVVGIVSMFVHFVSPTIYSWATLVIFSAFVLIDFARIRAGGDGRTSVQLAVQIYVDIINIFIALLRIFGSRRAD